MTHIYGINCLYPVEHVQTKQKFEETMATATAAETNPMVETQQDHNSANQQNGPIFIDTQHDDMVHDAQLDYYGCKLATSSSDRTVKIYDVSGSTYTHTATLQGHEGPVWEVSWAHPRF